MNLIGTVLRDDPMRWLLVLHRRFDLVFDDGSVSGDRWPVDLTCGTRIAMFRAQRILLKPTVAQERLFRGAAGLSRFAWNWAVAYLRKHYGIFGRGPDGKTRKGYKAPSAFTLQKRWNRIKDRRFQWVREYSNLIPRDSFDAVQKAYRSAFDRLKKTKKWNPPKFHKKGLKDSFSVYPDGNGRGLRVIGERINVPRIGFVKCVTPLRWPAAKQVRGRIKLIAGRWWLCLNYELPDPPKLSADRSTCGIDLGCTTFATIASGGEVIGEIAPPKPYAKAKRRLKRLQRRLTRRVKGSRRKAKARLAVAKAHKRVADIRADFLHQLSSILTKTFSTVVLEDLCVSGMARGWIAGTIQDLGFGEFRRQMEYKAESIGTEVVFAHRFYPSSKTCFQCKATKDELTLSQRKYECGCGWSINRDHNAALNLEAISVGNGDSHRESGGSGLHKKSGATRKTAKAEGTVYSTDPAGVN